MLLLLLLVVVGVVDLVVVVARVVDCGVCFVIVDFVVWGNHPFVSDFAQVAWANRKMSRREVTITEDCSIALNVLAWVANDFFPRGGDVVVVVVVVGATGKQQWQQQHQRNQK